MNLDSILPHIILALTAMGVLLAIAVRRNHSLVFGVCATGMSAAILTLPLVEQLAHESVGVLLVTDPFSLLVSGLLIASGLAVAFLAYPYLRARREQREEFYAVLSIATLGGVVLTGASHFVTFFLGIEVLSVGLFAMIGYLRDDVRSLEAGLKYLIMAGASSAFLLLGMALVYASAGTMQFGELAGLVSNAVLPTAVPLAGAALMAAGVGFKLAVVPFHMWTPDVYEGAPAPVTAFVATVSKGAVVAVLVRLYFSLQPEAYREAVLAVSIVAGLSMMLGNLLALLQANLKRLLAYSSIAHLGYLLVALVAGGTRGAEAAVVYLVVYSVSVLGAFAVISLLSGDGEEPREVEDFRGMFWRRPWTAAAFTAVLLSLAGMPLTAGFVGKFFVFGAGVSTDRWIVVLVMAVASGTGIFYYTRVVAVMFAGERTKAAPVEQALPIGGGLVLTILALVLLGIGLYPSPLVSIVRAMLVQIP